MKMKKIFGIIFVVIAMCGFTACSSDDFTESIFDTSIAKVDTTSTTAPFDQWLYDNFVLPYNTEIQYKFNLNASDMGYQLAPADYGKSQLLAHFIKYLFYDVYTKFGGKDFMKRYGPRIFHFIGSKSYSASTGTETLGYASSGVKITLINVNGIKGIDENTQYTPEDVDALNEMQFHTMHHEFSHILHQTKSYPVIFGQITPSTYDARNWNERDSVDSHTMGYVTQYGSSAIYEDFVETLSCTITENDCRWMMRIIDACMNDGVKETDKADINKLIDSLEIEGVDDPSKPWNNFKIYREEVYDELTGTWSFTGRFVPSFHTADSKRLGAQNSTESKTFRYKVLADQQPKSFRDYLNNWVQVSATAEIAGINAIMKKLDIATKWYTENYGLYLYRIRHEVRERQNNINEYIKTITIYDNK